MAGKLPPRSYRRGCHTRNEYEHEHRTSMPSQSTSRTGVDNTNRRSFYKQVTFKSNNQGNIRKRWENKSSLFREQLDPRFSNRYRQSLCNPGRRSISLRNSNRGSQGNFRNSSLVLEESSTGWYFIYVPHIENCDDVLKIIQTYIKPVEFYPYNKQYFDNALRFVVDDFNVAKKLYNTSYKIILQDNRKLVIKVFAYLPTSKPFVPVPSEVKETMMEAIATLYDSNTKSMDLSRFYANPLFTQKALFVPLNRPAYFLAVLNMVAQYTKHNLFALSLKSNHIYLGDGLVWLRRLFPDLKVLELADNKLSNFNDLKCLSGFTIEVLSLFKNPICDSQDIDHYKWSVQSLFPILQKLDNLELTSRYSAITDYKLQMPINLDSSYFIPDEQASSVVTLVESFVIQYYERYDNKVSRRIVADAYHINATLSLSSCVLTQNFKGNITQYLSESRNFMKLERHKYRRDRTLHRGRENIMHFLEKLPKTKHDLGSFFIDVPLANSTMVQFVVSGVFAEDFRETEHQHNNRSFSRAFCIVPVDSGWSIISDMLFVTVATHELSLESSKRFYVFKQKLVPLIKSYINTNSDNDSMIMFMEYTKEMPRLDASPLYQQPSTSSLLLSPLNPQTTLSPCHPSPKPVSNNHLDMLNNFSKETGMNNEWSKKCLEDNGWNYAKALLCFSKLKPNIPPAAFI